MKVLMYGWELPPNITGGLGVACHGIIQGLLDREIDITVVVPSSCAATEEIFQNRKKLKLIHNPFSHEIKNSYTALHNQNLLEKINEYANTAGVIAKYVSHDVIHAHDWLTVLTGLSAKKISGKNLVFHVHSLEVERSARPLNQVIYDIEKYGLQRADKIIAVSEFTKRNIVRYYQIHPDKISVVYNGLLKEQIKEIDSLQIDTKNKSRNVLFLGRVTHQKAPLHFIEAAYKIFKLRKDIHFIMAGDGDLFNDTIELAAKYKMSSHVHFTRFINRAQIADIFKISQIYVMPSVAEPFGLTCIEAIAHRLPVVCTKQSGVSEVVKNMLTVDYWDIDLMAHQIIKLMDNPTLQEKLIQNSIPEIKKLSWSETARKISSIYQQLIGG